METIIIVGILFILVIQKKIITYAQIEFDSDVHQNMVEQRAILVSKQEECLLLNTTHPQPINGSYCPTSWDGALCWSYVKAGTKAILPCPEYVTGFKPNAFATRLCLEDGKWFYRADKNTSWTNYTECFSQKYVNTVIQLDSQFDNRSLLFQNYVPVIKIISCIGYSISFLTLVVAFVILAVIKKLRCARNSLHMHLFASFILRAFVTLIKSNIFIESLGISSHVVAVNESMNYLREHDGWDCKVLTTMWQYFLMANYCWILMEGLYLHNLIFLALFSDNSGICLYVALGWGSPVIFIIIWVTCRVTLENTICWTLNENSLVFWIIRGPITLSIIVNFIFFINISRILFMKLTSSQAHDTRKTRYRKLAKSTLVLVPLFGVHYTIFLAMSISSGLEETTEIVWLACDQFFTSFQGFFVAVLYCFMNGEVQAELRRKWEYWTQEDRPNQGGRLSFLSQSLTYFTRQRTSMTSAGEQSQRRHKTFNHSPTNINTDCVTNTTITAASPRLEHPPDNCSFSFGFATSENNLSSFLDKSPTVEDKSGSLFGLADISYAPDTSTVLTPMLSNSQSTNHGNGLKEKIILFSPDRAENHLHPESTV